MQPDGPPPQPLGGPPPQAADGPPQLVAAPPAGTTVVHHYWYTLPEDKKEARQHKGKTPWQKPMISICLTEPGYCCYGCWCSCCALYTQRMRLLLEDIENYSCCGGVFPVIGETLPFCSGKLGLVCESIFCTFCGVQGNRYMIRRHYNLEFDKTEAYMYALVLCLECIAHCCEDTVCGDCAGCCAQVLYSVIMGCLLAQNHHQMNTLGYPWPEYQEEMT